MLTTGRYIQCVHTLWDPIVFTQNYNNHESVLMRHCRLKQMFAQHFMALVYKFLYKLMNVAWVAKILIGATFMIIMILCKYCGVP